jgi:Fe2+ or Zn2+ uptake regulation protein
MAGGVLTSFLDGFALAGLSTRLRRKGAPTRAFAPSKPKQKMVIVVDDDQAVETLEGLRRESTGLAKAGYSLVHAEVYIRDRCKVS